MTETEVNMSLRYSALLITVCLAACVGCDLSGGATTVQNTGAISREDAELKHIQDLVESNRRRHGDQAPQTLSATKTLANWYESKRSFDIAEQLRVQLLAAWQNNYGDEHFATLSAMEALAMLYHKQGRHEEAEPLLEKAVETMRRRWGDERVETLKSMANLASVYQSTQNYERAERLLKVVLEARSLRPEEYQPTRIAVHESLISLYESWDKPDEVARWKSQLDELTATTGSGRVDSTPTD